MFNIGFGELAIICIVLIIAVGPERLPSMMKTLGKTIRTLRQASRDIRASTGIDELMREDFDLYAPIKPAQPRRPAPMPEPAALPATAEGAVPATPAANVETLETVETVETEPKTVSREDVVESDNREDRPSVVVAPPPQAIGLPSDEPAPAPPPAAAEDAAASGNGAPIVSNVGTLPRAPIVQTAPPAAVTPEPQPEAANTDSASSESKQSGA